MPLPWSVVSPAFSEAEFDISQLDTMRGVKSSKRKSWPAFSLCARKTDDSRHRSISGRYPSPTSALVLRSNSYTNAKDWDGLMRALVESLKRSPPDEMILLLRDTASGRPERLSEHVRPVTYHLLYRVPKQLLSNAPNIMRTIITRAPQQQPCKDHVYGHLV